MRVLTSRIREQIGRIFSSLKNPPNYPFFTPNLP